jgi:REP element-mobilizing transposase RayT
MELPKRKPNRLPNFDYSTPGAYFITICTKDRKCILGDVVGASIARPQSLQLSKYGTIVADTIHNIAKHYPAVSVDHFVVMPNHIHLLLQINTDANGRPMVAPTISTVIQQLKGVVTKKIGKPIWQKLYHDHVIRGEADYLKIWEYIENNPAKWKEDCFYMEEDLL